MILSVLCLLMLWASPGLAATYYIERATGSDSNNATQAQSESTPWFSISKCVTQLNTSGAPGDTCLVKNGTYSETWQLRRSGTSGNPVSIKNYPGHRPVINVGQATSSSYVSIGAGFTSQTTSWVVFQGFEITGCWFAMRYFNVRDTVFADVIIHDNLASYVGHGVRVTITRNIIYRNGTLTNCGACNKDHGIYGVGSDYVVTNNLIYDNQAYGVQCTTYPFNASQHATTDDSACKGWLIANNTIAYERYRGAIVLYNDGGQAVVNHKVYNNIFYQNSQNLAAGNGAGIDINTASTTNEFKNNVFYATVGGTALVACSFSPCTAGVHYTSSGNSTSTNPNMTNATATVPASPDFTLTSGSVAIDFGITGTNVPIHNGSAPDAGAFETFTCASAVAATGNVVDITCQMNRAVPILPATGQTTWVVKFGGVARGTVSAVKRPLSDSVVQVTYDGAACESTDVMTVDFTSGNVTDSALIGNSNNQKLFSFTALAVNESACTGGGGGSPPAGPEIIYNMTSISGTTVPDSSGNANDGTTTGSPTVVTGISDDALSFADQVADYITAPWGSGLNPSTTSYTVCILVSPDSTSSARVFFGTPVGTNQRAFLSTFNSTWAMGIQSNSTNTNADFPVQEGWSLPCIVWDSNTDTATLWVNAVAGTGSQSVKTYTSHTWAGNFTFGMGNGFASTTAPGGDIDHVVVYESALNQSQMTELYESLITPSPTPTGSYEQKTHKWQRLRKKANGDEEDFTISGTTNGITMSVMVGGAIHLVTQIDCTGADCDGTAVRLFYNVNSGVFSQVNDTCGQVCFYGTTPDTDIISGAVTCCLTGALTANNGTTQFTSSAVPSFDLSQNASFVRRSVLKVGSDATVGDTICFKEYHQTGNALDAYTPSSGACITVVGVAAGVGF